MRYKGGEPLNQKAVNLHMLEDVLGWMVVLIGAIVMKWTDFHIIDPLMSIGVAIFILLSVLKNLKEILGIFLFRTPHGICINEIKNHLCAIQGVLDVHHVHVWSTDGHSNYATMHVVVEYNSPQIKDEICNELREHGIGHVTLELETKGEYCREVHCRVNTVSTKEHHHHHHH